MDISMKKRRAALQARGNERDYMMRSEKRPGYRPSPHGSHAPKPPQKKRRYRRKQSLPYVFFTFLLLIVLFPVGLIMLWTRTIRWTVSTKLSLTAGFAVVFVLLASFALTVKVDDPRVSMAQEKTRYALGVAGDAIQRGVSTLDLNPENIRRDAEDIAGYSIELGQRGIAGLAPMLEGDFAGLSDSIASLGEGVRKSGEDQARTLLMALGMIPTPMPSAEPSASPTPEVTVTPAPQPTPTPAPTALLAWYAAGDKRYHTRTSCPQLAAAPISMTVTEAVHRGLLPCELCAIPDALGPTEPAQTEAAKDATVLPEQPGAELDAPPDPSLNPEELQTRAPAASLAPTAEPTPIVLPPSKNAAEATVYYTSNGQYYHSQSSCGSMSGAKPHTLKEAVDADLKRCNGCSAPEPALLTAEVVVWCANNVFHITDECTKLGDAKSQLLSLEQAMEKAYTGCPECGANLYEEVARKYVNVTPVPAHPIEP